MRKFSFSCVIILIYFSQLTFPQNYVKLFSEFLPEKYLKHEDKVEQIEYDLNHFAKTNPDLIYYYINYLDLITEQNIFNRDSNYYNILQYENSISNRYNNKWLDEEINRAKPLPESELLSDELISLLEEFEVPKKNVPKHSTELKIDKNFQKFLTYKCITQDVNLIYDDNMDYHTKVEETIQNFVYRMKLDYKTNQSDFSKREDKIKKFHQYNIYSEGFSEGYNRKIDLNVSKYLLSLIDYSNFTEYSGINFGFSTELFRYVFPSQKISETNLPFEELTLANTTVVLYLLNLTAGYRLKLKEYKSAFSHLDFTIGLSFANDKITTELNSMELNKYIFIWAGEPTNFIYAFLGTINSVSWDINNFTSLAANLDVPIFYIKKNLFFEVGILYKFLLAEYAVTVEKDIREQSAIDPSILASAIESLSHKTQNHLFGGTLSLNYTMFNSLNVKGSISTLGSIYFGLDYFFRL